MTCGLGNTLYQGLYRSLQVDSIVASNSTDDVTHIIKQSLGQVSSLLDTIPGTSIHRVRRHFQVEAEGGQVVPENVMEFAGDPLAFSDPAGLCNRGMPAIIQVRSPANLRNRAAFGDKFMAQRLDPRHPKKTVPKVIVGNIVPPSNTDDQRRCAARGEEVGRDGPNSKAGGKRAS